MLVKLTFIAAALISLSIIGIVLSFTVLPSLYIVSAVGLLALAPILVVLSIIALVRDKSKIRFLKTMLVLYLILSIMFCLELTPFAFYLLTPNM